MLRLRIKEVAEAKGYTMAKLSRAADVPLNTMQRLYHRPEGGANIITLVKIAKVLEVRIDDLIEYVPDK